MNINSILVVDDEAAMREALQASLRQGKWDVDAASGLTEAVRKFKARNYRLVLIDMRMSDGAG